VTGELNSTIIAACAACGWHPVKPNGALNTPCQLRREMRRGGTINKQFLSRTIVGVGGHNRRQEEAACWQQLEASRAGPSQHRSRSPSPAGAPSAKRARCGGRGSELDVRVAAQPFTASYHVDENHVARPAACAGARAEPVEGGADAAQASSGAGSRPTEVQEQRVYWAQRKSRAALHPDKAAEDRTESEDSNAKKGKKPKKPKKDHKERKRSKRKKSKRAPMKK
jgi:hypothetical protein